MKYSPTIILILWTSVTFGQTKSSADTIFSYKAIIPQDFYIWGAESPDSYYYMTSYDSINNVKVFVRGENAYVSHLDTSNKSQWPFVDNWITWPLFSVAQTQTLFGEGQIFGNGQDEKNLSTQITFIQLAKNERQLVIKWNFAINGMHVWTETSGQQIWNLQTRTCFLDIVTRDYSYSSGGTASDSSQTKECIIDIKNNQDNLVISKNNCGDNPKAGQYKLIGQFLIKQKP